MSIATALTALADDVSAAKAAIEAKGGTAPAGTADMADAIAAIPSGGITPTGKITITENGTDIDVAQYALADVNVSGGGSLPSSITKIDGGSFTLAADAVCSQYEIAHNMGVPPMGFTIWTDELNEFAAQSKQYMMWVNTRIFTVDTNSTTTRYGLYGVCARQSSGNVYQNQSYHYDVEGAERWCNASRIKAHIGDQYFKAGITYHWVAWV